jgi:hypothetical protein
MQHYPLEASPGRQYIRLVPSRRPLRADVPAAWRARVLDALQGLATVVIDEWEYSRTPYGEERQGGRPDRCPHCNAVRGGVHLPVCPREECPRCRRTCLPEDGCRCERWYDLERYSALMASAEGDPA